MEKRQGILNSIRYFLAPRDLFENIQKLEQEIISLRIEKESELRYTQRLLNDRETEIRQKENTIAELKKELTEITLNAPAKLEADRKKRQSENIHTILNPKQLGLFKILSQGEKNYTQILESAHNSRLDVRDIPALRVQLSRLNRKLTQESVYAIDKIQRPDGCYFTIR